MEAVATRYTRKLSQYRLSTFVYAILLGILLFQFVESAWPKYSWLGKHRERTDFHSFYLTAVDKFQNNNSLYHLHRTDAHSLSQDEVTDLRRQTFPNFLPPLTTMVYLPFTLLPWESGRDLWFIGSILLLFAGLLVLGSILRVAGVKTDALLVLVCAMAWITHCKWLFLHFFHGQINLQVMFLFWAGVYFHIRKKPNFYFAAALIGLSIMVKPFMAIGLVPLLIYRSHKMIYLVPLACMAIIALTLPWVGIDDYLQFPRVLMTSPYVELTEDTRHSYSLRGHVLDLLRALGWERPQTWTTMALPVLFGLQCYRESVRRLPLVVQLIRIAQAFLFMGAVMMVTWMHHFVLIYPLLFILLSIYLGDVRRWILQLSGLILLYVLMQYALTPMLPGYWHSMGLVGLWLVAEGTVASLKTTGPNAPVPFVPLAKMAVTK